MIAKAPTTFEVRWFDVVRGQVQHESVLAVDLAAARAHVQARVGASGSVVLSASRPGAAADQASPAQARHAAASGEIAWWCRELRTLLTAGMTIIEALETVEVQTGRHDALRTNTALIERLRAGRSLSTAMDEVGTFPAVLIAGIRASERTSSVAGALDDFLRYDEMLQRLRKQIVSAAIYPAVVAGLGAVISITLILFVVPRFGRMYEELRGSTTWTTQALLAVSRFLQAHPMLVAAGVVGSGLGVVLAWRRGWLWALLLSVGARIEPLQRQFDDYRLAKLYQSLSLLFRGGYPLDESLILCGKLRLGGRMAPAIEAAHRSLTRGVGVARAFEEAGLCDVVTTRLLAVGERSGHFDAILATIGERHASRFTTFVERATRIAEPALLLVVALTVGALVVALYMPVFDIASSVE